MSSNDEKIEELRKAVDNAENIVFFGGAGVSTESGLPDFRGEKGLYTPKYDLPPASYLSARLLKYDPEEFFKFQRKRILGFNVQPNAAHLKLAEWEKQGKLRAVITQNIDGLHQAAGSKKVIELHGNTMHCHCMVCHKAYKISAITETEGVPRCKICHGIIKPDTVLYDEKLDARLLKKAADHIRKADMLIVGGTSLKVSPAVSLVHEFKNKPFVLINKGLTPMDERADIRIYDKIGEVFSAL
ncbi:NAD-dependent protein deacylase [uncultured Ruminococcus sp.]|uniref:NAD-dependent protein deacylase n=1 Tax=uncultured Ruminococcus sp. TaxID=165186 RepID=UPI0025D1F147|nr:NAD-dependent protein deacylase [uncultured Ruminococcus sp.]